MTPSGFTFIIWAFIYAWQVQWIIYAWSFLCRPKMPRTIFVGVFISYTFVNLTNITWIYVWGNLYVSAASGLLILFNIFQYLTLAMLVVYFYKVRAHHKPNKWDVLLTWFFPINGLFFYATWTTIASLINLIAALQYSSDIDVSATNSGTIALSLLLVTLVVYFVLENTVFDRYLRYVLSVYPVVIWALIGVLVKHWDNEDEERNTRFALGLLIISIVVFIVRIGLVIAFSIFRPLNHNKSDDV